MRCRSLLLLLMLAACGARSDLAGDADASAEDGAGLTVDQTAPAPDAPADASLDALSDASIEAPLDQGAADADASAVIDAPAADAPSTVCGQTPAWLELAPSGAAPAGRGAHAAIEDETNGRMVIFGGETTVMGVPTELDDTWAVTPNESLLLSFAGPTPPPRSYGSAIHDADQQRLVLFGGAGFDAGALGDLWYFALGTSGLQAGGPWTQSSPVGNAPSPRRGQCAVHDVVNRRMIVFGGDDGTMAPLHDDVWALSLSGAPTWTQLSPSGPGPAGRAIPSCVYDEAGARMIVFGGSGPLGFGAGSLFDDVWALSLSGAPAWTLLLPAGSGPAGRAGHTAVYDASCRRMIVFGGETDQPPFIENDLWSLSLSGSPIWAQLAAQGTLPAPRLLHSAVWNAQARQMTLFGGLARMVSPPFLLRNDEWVLSGL